MPVRTALALLAAGLLATAAMAREQFGTLPEPPAAVEGYRAPAAPAAAAAEDEPIPEPEVTITTRGDERREEYRIGGRLYMVKVTPRRGPPYYLIDPDGRGEFTRSDLAPAVSPPTWVLKRF